jgi:hypothetical protein
VAGNASGNVIANLYAFATQPWENGPPANLRWVIDPSRVANRPDPDSALNATPIEDVGLKVPSARLLLWRGSSAGDAQQLGRESLYHLIVEN